MDKVEQMLAAARALKSENQPAPELPARLSTAHSSTTQSSTSQPSTAQPTGSKFKGFLRSFSKPALFFPKKSKKDGEASDSQPDENQIKTQRKPIKPHMIRHMVGEAVLSPLGEKDDNIPDAKLRWNESQNVIRREKCLKLVRDKPEAVAQPAATPLPSKQGTSSSAAFRPRPFHPAPPSQPLPPLLHLPQQTTTTSTTTIVAANNNDDDPFSDPAGVIRVPTAFETRLRARAHGGVHGGVLRPRLKGQHTIADFGIFAHGGSESDGSADTSGPGGAGDDGARPSVRETLGVGSSGESHGISSVEGAVAAVVAGVSVAPGGKDRGDVGAHAPVSSRTSRVSGVHRKRHPALSRNDLAALERRFREQFPEMTSDNDAGGDGPVGGCEADEGKEPVVVADNGFRFSLGRGAPVPVDGELVGVALTTNERIEGRAARAASVAASSDSNEAGELVEVRPGGLRPPPRVYFRMQVPPPPPPTEHSGALYVTQPADVRAVRQKRMDFALLAVRLLAVRRG
ncbi:hypothetical protein N0V88_000994 [Collariella sp. IMI 366227]|nr:hypothetical protein N0V88_000994 [Collariella sp. IMI 366227]